MNQETANRLFPVLIIFISFITLSLFFIITLGIRYRRKKFESERLALEFEKTLLQSQLEIQEQTLHHISQEIHDNIGQLLGLIKLNIATTDVEIPEEAKSKQAVNLELIGRVTNDIRQLSHVLDPSLVDRLGLLQAITSQLELVEKTGSLLTKLEVIGENFYFDGKKELILFRIVQETFNNVLKHAKASELLVTIHYKPSTIAITITDNGIGFDSAQGKNGIGLKNMQDRAKIIGAVFSVSSEIGKGTSTFIELEIEKGT